MDGGGGSFVEIFLKNLGTNFLLALDNKRQLGCVSVTSSPLGGSRDPTNVDLIH